MFSTFKLNRPHHHDKYVIINGYAGVEMCMLERKTSVRSKISQKYKFPFPRYIFAAIACAASCLNILYNDVNELTELHEKLFN